MNTSHFFQSKRDLTLFITANVELLNYVLNSLAETVGYREFWELNGWKEKLCAVISPRIAVKKVLVIGYI